MKNYPIRNTFFTVSALLCLTFGVSAQAAVWYVDIDNNAFDKVESIIFSMTPAERNNPELLNMSRKNRIAEGCGRDVHEINLFIKQFDQMRKMMKMMSKGKNMQNMMQNMQARR